MDFQSLNVTYEATGVFLLELQRNDGNTFSKGESDFLVSPCAFMKIIGHERQHDLHGFEPFEDFALPCFHRLNRVVGNKG